jgi:four helix bundle protein
MRFERFEDIDAWRAGRELTRAVYRSSKRGPFALDFALRDQIRSAAISVTSNIAEGYERGGDNEFIHALSVAKGSCGEVRSQLSVALDEGYVTEAQFHELNELALHASRLISGLMKYLQTSPHRGVKFKRGHSRTDLRPET